MNSSSTQSTSCTNTAGVPPTPPEAHQRADREFEGRATYSPEDNKLRMVPYSRLDRAIYDRLKGAGFHWAAVQGFFVAPMWTPGREDLLIELCGDIEDEDSTLAERADERADRFQVYQQKRGTESAAARLNVEQIAGRFEFGQPILIGHHSERRARKDKERIDDGMRKAVRLWDTAEYWKYRAAGAIAHAKYKELPAVRARRIKKLQADQRGHLRTLEDCEARLALWQREGLTLALALDYSAHSFHSRCFTLAEFPRNPPASQYEGSMGIWSALDGGVISAEQAQDISIKALTSTINWARRWSSHYENRISYEKAMLDEGGGLAADKFDIQPGGRVLVGGEWCVVKRLNKKDGEVCSVSIVARFSRVRGIEEVKDYRPPSVDEAAAVKSATTLPPMCNYPGEGIHEMTKAEWEAVHKDYKGSRQLGQGAKRSSDGYGRPEIKVTDSPEVGLHRVRVAMVGPRRSLVPVFLSDVTRKDAPKAVLSVQAEAVSLAPVPALKGSAVTPAAEAVAGDVEAMREALRTGGVKTVTAPQLFATPADLAARKVEIAQIPLGGRVLEPNAGTGAILKALPGVLPFGAQRQTWAAVVAVEINSGLCAALRESGLAQTVICGDFLQQDPASLGFFDVILMNPPFADAQDIAHILHARQFLKLGGRLVATCAGGPRQRKALQQLAEESGGSFEELPAGTFKESGTGVNTALVVILA